MFDRLALRYRSYGPPIIVFNKSHSGSRLLARIIIGADIFMGAELNESYDSPDILRLVHHLIERHYPNYSNLMRRGDPDLEDLIMSVFDRHLATCPTGGRWGWKLCETLYILPVLKRIFPDAHFIHLVRDGRDVAFSDHVAPVDSFWKKVYFDTDDITEWQGFQLNQRNYKKNSPLFNAQHWTNSVRVARHYGSMIGERYIEIHFEDLVERTVETSRGLFQSVGIVADETSLAQIASTVVRSPIGKYKKMPARTLRKIQKILEPQLQAFGYDGVPPQNWVKKIMRKWS